jgi:hypothetical protein
MGIRFVIEIRCHGVDLDRLIGFSEPAWHGARQRRVIAASTENPLMDEGVNRSPKPGGVACEPLLVPANQG